MTAMKRNEPIPRRSLRVGEFSRLYGLSRATIYRLIKSGELRTIKLGGCRLIPVDAAESLLTQP